MFGASHSDTVETETRASPAHGNDDGQEDELMLGEAQKLTLDPSNQSDGRHVREASNRWSTPDQDSNVIADPLSTQSTSPTPHSEYTDRGRPLQPLAATAESPEGSSSEEEPSIGKRRPNNMQLQLGVWDVINQEILDSFGVYGTRGLLDCEQKALKLTTPGPSLTMHSCGPGGLPPELDKQEALISLVAVQLLAACFTLPPEPTPGSLPSAFYYTRWKESSPPALSSSKCNLPDPRLISCLGLHARYRHAPAAGHHARNPSVVPAWPDLYSGPSREELLADEVCKRRRLRLQAQAQSSGSIAMTTNDSGYSFSPSLDGSDIHNDVAAPAEKCRCQRSFLQKGLGRATTGPSRPSSIIYRANDRSSNSRYADYWSLRPVLHAEAHPVFIQPVKDLVMKRWRAIRSAFVPPSPDRGRPRLESVAERCTCASALTGRAWGADGETTAAGSDGVCEQQCHTSNSNGNSKRAPDDDGLPLYELTRAISLPHFLPKPAIPTQKTRSDS
ncbi:MAG: hypothetical protein M1840_001158 [Geoglossum simile]|nr:MAG: hypothetical protein M1840_001158 [Geoglossum simile]